MSPTLADLHLCLRMCLQLKRDNKINKAMPVRFNIAFSLQIATFVFFSACLTHVLHVQDQSIVLSLKSISAWFLPP